MPGWQVSSSGENEKAVRLLWWELVGPTLSIDGISSHEPIRQVKPKVPDIYGQLARNHPRRGNTLKESFRETARKDFGLD